MGICHQRYRESFLHGVEIENNWVSRSWGLDLQMLRRRTFFSALFGRVGCCHFDFLWDGWLHVRKVWTVRYRISLLRKQLLLQIFGLLCGSFSEFLRNNADAVLFGQENILLASISVSESRVDHVGPVILDFRDEIRPTAMLHVEYTLALQFQQLQRDLFLNSLVPLLFFHGEHVLQDDVGFRQLLFLPVLLYELAEVLVNRWSRLVQGCLSTDYLACLLLEIHLNFGR